MNKIIFSRHYKLPKGREVISIVDCLPDRQAGFTQRYFGFRNDLSYFKQRLTIAAFVLLLPLAGFAQADWENPKGAIKDEQVVIEKEKQITLPVISRRFEAITIDLPKRDTTMQIEAPKDISLALPKIPVRLRPKTMKAEPLQKTYWGTFKVGYGSYISPYLQADVATKRSDEYAFTAHFKHFSSKNGPVDKGNSGMSTNDAFLNGKLFLNKFTLGAHLGAQLNKYHLYGYSEDISTSKFAEDIEQKLTNYSIGIDLTDNDKNEDFTYRLSTGVELFNAKNLLWKESDFGVGVTSWYSISDDLNIRVDGDLHVSKQEKGFFALTTNRLFYKVKPVVTYTMSPFEFEIGAGIFGTKDSINSFNHKLYIAPHVVARYTFESGQSVSAGVTGDVTWQSARTRFNENPYLNDYSVVNNDVKPIEFFVKSIGKLAPKLTYELGFNSSLYKQIGMYKNSTVTDTATFELAYATGNNLVHQLSAKLDIAASKNFDLQLFGNYFIYNFENNATPWHMPELETGIKTRFTLEDKLTVDLAFSYILGRKGYDPISTETITLNPIADLNVSADYKINSMVSVFIKMQNVIGNQYQYFYRYPSRGFQGLGGVRLSF